ncbi:unnamed protein product [Polarella glacialis]|uniref:Uncharacterized protein n=1 Tax=Polarella glacialis TaxID=89957 RepID=A0A813KEZ7_POLGL|nr:unnamed protein product [Polarella glacialis]
MGMEPEHFELDAMVPELDQFVLDEGDSAGDAEEPGDMDLDLSIQVDGFSVATASDFHSGNDFVLDDDDDENDIGQPANIIAPVLRGLPHAFRWAFMTLMALQLILGPSIQQSLLMRQIPFSTHFSGMGSPEVAAEMLSAAAVGVLGFPLMLTSCATCDIDRKCQSILLQRSCGACLFGNILDLRPSWDKKYAHFEQAWAALLPAVTCPPRLCARHGQCGFQAVACDIAGSPCQPWSRSGKRKGKADARVALLLVGIAMLLRTLPLLALHENVFGFDTTILDALHGGAYAIYHLRVKPAHMGFGLIRRSRVYSILFLKAGLRVAHNPQHVYQRGLAPVAELSGSWGYLLTPKQRQFQCGYEVAWQRQYGIPADEDSNCAFDLSQDPQERPSCTTADGSLPTLRLGSLIWVSILRRFLVPFELAAATGFPVNDALATSAQVALDLCCEVYTVPILGNGMHVASLAEAGVHCSGGVRDENLVRNVVRAVMEGMGKNPLLQKVAAWKRRRLGEPEGGSFAVRRMSEACDERVVSSGKSLGRDADSDSSDDGCQDLIDYLKIMRPSTQDIAQEGFKVHEPRELGAVLRASLTAASQATSSGGISVLQSLPKYSGDKLSKNRANSSVQNDLAQWLESEEATEWRKYRDALRERPNQ